MSLTSRWVLCLKVKEAAVLFTCKSSNFSVKIDMVHCKLSIVSDRPSTSSRRGRMRYMYYSFFNPKFDEVCINSIQFMVLFVHRPPWSI
jgi:hypothetical protein